MNQVETIYSDNRKRTDSQLTKLIRMCSKIPVDLTKRKDVVKISGYKSKNPKVFGREFRHAFDAFIKCLIEHELFDQNHGHDMDFLFILFCLIHYPKSKVIELAKSMNMDMLFVRKYLGQRSKTT